MVPNLKKATFVTVRCYGFGCKEVELDQLHALIPQLCLKQGSRAALRHDDRRCHAHIPQISFLRLMSGQLRARQGQPRVAVRNAHSELPLLLPCTTPAAS